MRKARQPLDLAEAEAQPTPRKPSGSATADLPEMTVTASPFDETSYTVPNATTATETDTPIMQTPFSIQVVPQQVMEDIRDPDQRCLGLCERRLSRRRVG